MGVGGTGKRSCCHIANFVMHQQLYTIEIIKDYKVDKNWKTDIKAFLMNAGSKRIQTTFLLNDTQLIHEKMLEDLNNILNSGHVPNI